MMALHVSLASRGNAGSLVCSLTVVTVHQLCSTQYARARAVDQPGIRLNLYAVMSVGLL